MYGCAFVAACLEKAEIELQHVIVVETRIEPRQILKAVHEQSRNYEHRQRQGNLYNHQHSARGHAAAVASAANRAFRSAFQSGIQLQFSRTEARH